MSDKEARLLPPQITIQLQGKPDLLRKMEDQNEFVDALRLVLIEGAVPNGAYLVSIDSQLKGSAHTQGMQIGMPNLNRRSIEIKWQGGGNGTRFGFQLSVHHDHDLMLFHSFLDQGLKRIYAAEDEEQMQVTQSAGTEGQMNPTLSSVEISADEIEIIILDLVPRATAGGVITKDDCLEVIGKLGWTECGAVLDFLLRAKHLDSGKTKKFASIPAATLAIHRQPIPDKIEVAPGATAQAPAPTLDILSEVARLTKIVDESKRRRQHLPSLIEEVATLKASLETAERQLAETHDFLSDPQIDSAEKMLESLRSVLGVGK